MLEPLDARLRRLEITGKQADLAGSVRTAQPMCMQQSIASRSALLVSQFSAGIHSFRVLDLDLPCIVQALFGSHLVHWSCWARCRS